MRSGSGDPLPPAVSAEVASLSSGGIGERPEVGAGGQVICHTLRVAAAAERSSARIHVRDVWSCTLLTTNPHGPLHPPHHVTPGSSRESAATSPELHAASPV
ncbi:hypothetical protein GCM10009679_66660 [Saccharothrix algeriensis]|uniref:Uncharacterized protein n=1 Tax=Catellatospora bangladeshensis TaxID=310355 RepID=A0A8J3JD65_9ACTN|nr:hypothetical protein Cba03nite_40610 [Catellatospora bangladeshensis]